MQRRGMWVVHKDLLLSLSLSWSLFVRLPCFYICSIHSNSFLAKLNFTPFSLSVQLFYVSTFTMFTFLLSCCELFILQSCQSVTSVYFLLFFSLLLILTFRVLSHSILVSIDLIFRWSIQKLSCPLSPSLFFSESYFSFFLSLASLSLSLSLSQQTHTNSEAEMNKSIQNRGKGGPRDRGRNDAIIDQRRSLY